MIRAHPLNSNIRNLLMHKLNDGSDERLKDLVDRVALYQCLHQHSESFIYFE